ncbi:MAG: hypothetical protein WD965_04870 [Actinomycetota bacterium]
MSDDPTNPDEEPMYPDEPQVPEDPEAGHDDIMKRLVDYQKQLREGVEPTEAAAVAWHREPRDPGQTEQPKPTAPPGDPVPSWEEPDVVDVSSPGSEAEAEAEAETQSEQRPEVHSFDQPSDRVEILTSEEAEASPARPWERPPSSGAATSRTEVSDRISQLEGTLDRLSKLLGDLRENFQGMAVTADERLAAIEAEIERNRERPDDSS